jgi:type IV pilus assembly protein PilF
MIKKTLLFSFLLSLLTACSTNTTQGPSGVSGASIAAPNPTAANYNVQLGVGYLQQGDVQRAKQKLLLAQAQAPDSAQVQDAMGYFHENTGDNQAAQNSYLKALALDNKSGASQNNYGAFLCRTGHYQEAVQHFLLAVQDPNYLNTAEAYENAGLCALQIPDLSNAQSYFLQAVQHDPRRANSYLELAQLSFNQNNFVQAQQYFNQYTALTPNMSPEGLWLGIRLARQANDNATAGRYVLTLQSKYPSSKEYKQMMAAPKPKSPTKQLMY